MKPSNKRKFTQAKANKLGEKIIEANEIYEKWVIDFKVEALKKYYAGEHYQNQTDEYYVNMFWSTIERKLPGMIFTNPKFSITPKPAQLATNSDLAFVTASNLSDALFDWTSEDKNNFSSEAEMCCLDAFLGFGVMEVGYSASYSQNPMKLKPAHPQDEDADVSKDEVGEVIDITVDDENVFARQIPFERFRVSSINHRYLEQCEWFGYYEYVRVADLKADKNMVDTHLLDSGDHSSVRVGLGISSNYGKSGQEQPPDCVKLWKIWETRTRKFKMYVEDANLQVFETKWKVNPIEILTYRHPREGFFPIPYSYNWIPQQNELNETRETQRVHRRKFKRLYEVKQGAVALEDIKNFLNGPDGGCIQVTQLGQIQPIPIAELGASDSIMAQVSKEDFNVVSGTSAEMQGQSDRVTATQANITNQRATVREARERTLVGQFLIRVAKKILTVMKNHYVNPRYVNSQKNDPIGSEMSTVPKARKIDPMSDFGDADFDFEVTVSVESMSPVQNEEEKDRFLSFLALLKQFPEFAISPNIIREMAFRVGYKNETIIRDLQQMATLSMAAQASMGQQNMQNQGGNLSQQTVEGQTPPNMEQIEQQMMMQGMPPAPQG